MKAGMKKIAVSLLACSLSGGTFAQGDLASLGSWFQTIGADATGLSNWTSQHVNMTAVNGVANYVSGLMNRSFIPLDKYAIAEDRFVRVGVPSGQASSITTHALQTQIRTLVKEKGAVRFAVKLSSDPTMNNNQQTLLKQINAIPANHAADVTIQLNSGATAAEIHAQGPAFFAAIKATLAQLPNRNIAVNAYVDTNQLSSKAGLAAFMAGAQQLQAAFPNSSHFYYSGSKPPAMPGINFQPASSEMTKALQTSSISDSMVNVVALPGQSIKQAKESPAPAALMRSLNTPSTTSVPSGMKLMKDNGAMNANSPSQVPTEQKLLQHQP